ncbi:hypothetical protein FDP41_006454 [Naegleria fowleri]|uniref:Adenylate cyclase-associated CAP C-terminal domain-containing protein n=1 Tax=Naegleria fowleri TaxID=5763 RepID=A0A6A5BHX2_NAEFO|nr:uncharacterized protein FDP41_006454 [Naegleria fowleri]KAF0974422.1 hypothetical protein FDP41_006454 [Naegleria fowleri]CAG4717916.1 unnamed protein product [Naegleria fowleri]
MSFPPSPFARRTQQFITHNNTTVEENNFQSNDLLYVTNSNHANIKLTGARCMKIILDGNNHSTLTFNVNSITTGFVEVMKCDSTKIIIGPNCVHKINTLQLDALNNCEIIFNLADENSSNIEYMTNFCSELSIISNIECKNIKMIIQTESGTVLFDSLMIFETVEEHILQNNRSSIQFKSKFSPSTAVDQTISMETEIVIREGLNGYVSTKKEKQAKDKIQQEFDEKMDKFFKTNGL